MKVTKRKRANRILTFFERQCGFRKPFQVLLDGTFCQAALRERVNIREQLTSYLCDGVRLFTTSCAIHEVDGVGMEAAGAAHILKQFALHECGHKKSPVSGSECLTSMVDYDNANHYFVGTQDVTLRAQLRRMAGVPLLFVHHHGLMLEKPSEVNLQLEREMMDVSSQPETFRVSVVKQLKEEILGPEVAKPKRRKKSKNPNPLSCLKKKVKTPAATSAQNGQKRRRRHKRLKLPQHVKEALAHTRT